MKLKLFIPLALLMGCQTVKKAEEIKGANNLLEDVKTLSAEEPEVHLHPEAIHYLNDVINEL